MSEVAAFKPKQATGFAELSQAEKIRAIRANYPCRPNPFQVGDIVRFRPKAAPYAHKQERDDLGIVLAVRTPATALDWVIYPPHYDIWVASLRFCQEEQQDIRWGDAMHSDLFELVERASPAQPPASAA